jgi:quercetin dioxygenase-like cupin family protein
MKKMLFLTGGMIMVLFLSSYNAEAQDWKNVNPKMNHILADTTFLRGTLVTLEPGEKSDWHTHPAHFFYALTEGKMVVHYKDGTKEEYNMKPGDSGMSGPERPHMTENTGKTTIKFLIVELKEHPYKSTEKIKK